MDTGYRDGAQVKPSRTMYVIGGQAFVPHPAWAGLWIRTDTSVVKVACAMCGAAVGEPCRRLHPGASKLREPMEWTSTTHYPRRNAAKRTAYPTPSDFAIIRAGA